MHWSTFVLATLLAMQENPDKFTGHVYNILFDRPPKTSLEHAVSWVKTPQSESAIMRRLAAFPEVTAKVHEFESEVSYDETSRGNSSDKRGQGGIELLKDTGKRRPSTFPGQDSASRSTLQRLGFKLE